MKLFCSAKHEGRPGRERVHDFTPAEVERIVYVLQATYADAVCNPDDGEQELRGTDAHLFDQPCLLDVLAWSEDIEMYGEIASETVEARRLQS